ncbi:Oligopeptide transport ATP-binding protein OppD [compost metagenome]
MAIACEPELLIADEPTTALDVTVQAEILDLLRRLQRERQMTMILVTHDLGVAAGHADDIAVMYAGQIVEKSPTEALFRAPRMPYTRDLLRAIPRLEDQPHAALHTIGGRPPAVHSLAGGCRYAPRCDRRTTRCDEQRPELVGADVPAARSFRCWYPLEMTE